MAHGLVVPSSAELSRRRLLSLGIIGLGSLIGAVYTIAILRYIIPGGGSSEATFENVGPASKFQTEVPVRIPLGGTSAGEGATGGAWIVKHSDTSFTAFDMHCTHLSCPYEWQPPGGTDGVFACPCHGSVFNKDGSVSNGPAFIPLHKRAAQVQNGNFLVGNISD